MSRPWDDCRFFLVSECLRKNCFYRHHAPAKDAQLCPKWASGACQKLDCDSMHFIFKQKSEMNCHFENMPSGCFNLNCNFKHLKPRPTKSATDEKVAKYLAELEGAGNKSPSEKDDQKKSSRKSSTSSNSDEEDLMAMRARILQSQARARAKTLVKKTVIRETTPDPEILRPTFNVASPPKNLTRKIVATKKGFSDDDQSDISLDELTDEEQEDLRAQLNKNKEPVSIRRVDDQFRIVESSAKEQEKPVQKPIKRSGRIISIRNENVPELKRDSSSEWVERKITIKQKPKKEKAKNPLVTRVVTNNFAATSSDASSCEEEPARKKPSKKRKPNTSWASAKDEKSVRNRLGNKDEEDLSKQILKARLNRFGGEVSKSQNPVSVVKRLTLTTGGGVKSRLGGAAAAILAKECKSAANQASNSKASVKKRLGESQARNEQKVNENKKEAREPRKKTVNPLRRKRSASTEKIPVVQEKQPKTDETNSIAVNPFENSYDVPDIEENKSIETVLQKNSTTSAPREAEVNEPTQTTTKTQDLISDPDVRKSPKKQVSRKPSVASVASRRPSSRALEDMDDLDELLLGDEETDNLDLGGDIDDEDLFA